MSNPPAQFYTLNEVAEILKVHKRTVRNIISRREIAVTYISRREPRITKAALDRYVASRTVKIAQ